MAARYDSFLQLKKELDTKNVSLIAVSKMQSHQKIKDLYELGQRDFGENYVQELITKNAQLANDIRWHFIGHLQTNKVKIIAPYIHMIQSVDSKKILKEINKEALKNNRKIKCLLQVHIAEEATKYGIDAKDLDTIFSEANEYKGVSLCGLMGMATFTDDQEKVKKEFIYLKKLFDQYFSPKKDATERVCLSMGMSDDYELAINNGSNMVRIGSLIFGARG